MKLSTEQIKEFANYLCREEKGTATREKYLRDVRMFCEYADGNGISKELILAWKKDLIESGYAVRSINSMLASVNSLLDFVGLSNCKVKNIRTQRQTYCTEDKALTKAEHLRLLSASKPNEQLMSSLKRLNGLSERYKGWLQSSMVSTAAEEESDTKPPLKPGKSRIPAIRIPVTKAKKPYH